MSSFNLLLIYLFVFVLNESVDRHAYKLYESSFYMSITVLLKLKEHVR